MRFAPLFSVSPRLRVVCFAIASLLVPAALRAQATAPAVSFGSVNVGTPVSATVTFTFSASTTISSVSVVTQGVTGLDFQPGTQNGTACKARTFAQNSTCTVVVNFKPATPGLRTGAVLLYDNEATPAVVATGYISGTGNSAQAVIYPGTQTTLFPSLAGSASGVVLDSNGNIFLSTSNGGVITKETLAGSSYTVSTFGSNLSQSAYNFAIDGAGNVFFPFGYTYKNSYTPSTGTYTQSTASQTGGSATIIDANNDLFATVSSNLQELTPNGSGYTASTAGGSFRSGYGLAFDSNLNIFVADAGNSNLVELPCAGGTCNGSYPTTITLANNLGNIVGVATDPAGTVYVAANYTPALLRYLPNGSGLATVLPQVGSFNSPDGVALDRLGNVYITDNGSGQALKEINVSAPQTFAFGSAVVGSTAPTKTATLTNIGNLPMTLTGLAFSNPAFSSGAASSCTASTVLQPTGSCTVVVQFSPTATVIYNATLTFTDNALGVPGSTQTVTLTGTGAENLVFTTAPPASTQTGGNVGSVTIAFETYNNSIDTSQTSAITLNVTGPGNYSQTYTQPAVNGQATFNLSAAGLTATGGYLYTPSATATGATFYPNTASTTVYPYRLAISGVTTPQTASNTTNAVTVAVVTNSGAATTQTNQITLVVSGPSGYTPQTYGPTTASASTGAVTFTTGSLPVVGTYIYTVSSNASPDGIAVTGTASTQNVVAGPASSLTVASSSTPLYVGQADTITVTAYDAYGNLANSTNDTVALTSSDSTATLPANFALASGTATASITFGQPGNFSVTATDTTSPSVSGTVSVTVTALPVFTVTTATDDATGIAANCPNQANGGAASSTCSLRDAFAAVTALNNASTTSYVPTINFAASLYGQTLTMAAAQTVNGNVALTGPGAGANAITLSGNNAVGFLTQNLSSITTISGLTLSNFKNSASSVLVAGATVNLTNDTVSNNTGGNSGGAMSLNGAITITGCTFTGNSATGGTSVSGGAFTTSQTSLTISNSQFSNNTASGSGGAISTTGTGAISIVNTAFLTNKASGGNGGAVLINASTAPLTITNDTFNNNTATISGGALYTAGLLTITGSSFSSNQSGSSSISNGGAIDNPNTTTGSSITNTNFIGNKVVTTGSIAYGGALYANRMNLTNVLFSGNSVSSASTANGGGAYFNGTSTSTFTGVTFTGNSTGGGASAQSGGAIYANASQLTLYNTTITGNSAKTSGGYFRAGGSSTLYNSVISGNTAPTSPDINLAPTTNGNSYFNLATPCSGNCTPLLSALGSYGGGSVGAVGYTTPVQVMIPLPGSPLLAAGSLSYVGTPGTLSGGATTDARGIPNNRTLTQAGATHVDIGAAEANYSMAFVQQPTNTTVGTAISPTPSVQIYESGVPFNATGGTLGVTASAGTPSVTSVAINASPVPVSVSFPKPESGDALIANVTSGAATPVTVASATSAAFNITNSAASLAFGMGPAAQVKSGGNAGIVTVNMTTAGGAVYTTGTDTITLTVTAPGYTTATYPVAAVNGVATFNLSGVALTTAATYSYTASDTSATPYTTDTVMATETVAADTVDHFTVTGIPAYAIPGTAYTVTVTAINPGGATDTAFAGPVFLASTDAAATFTPQNYTYVTSDAGVHSFTVTLNTSGLRVVSVSNNTGQTGAETGIFVAGSVWTVNATGTLSKLNGAGAAVVGPVGMSGTASVRGGVAFDAAGGAWSVTQQNNSLDFVNKVGTGAVSFSGNGLSAPVAVAIDGAGMVWVANSAGSTVSVFSNAGAAVSATTDASISGASAVAIDVSGNVWVTNATGNSVDEVIGGAAPVMPLATAAANGVAGTKP